MATTLSLGLISAVFGYYLITPLLNELCAEYYGFGVQPVWFSLFVIVSIALATLSLCLKRVSDTNPMDSLWYEY